MSQKDYNLAIVENLLRKPNHIRGIAKDLVTNQTTVARKMKQLYEGNIVDFRQEGRNKVFALKSTLEAKQQACIAELHKAIGAVKRYPRLRAVFEGIRRDSRITLAVLFGSYAKGVAGKESDIDIYIDTADRRIKKEVELIDSRISAKIGRYDRSQLLIREIEKNHVIIKGVEEYYEKSGFFAQAV